ncbi:MAG: amidase [Microthrixaceae bacterium]
MAQRVNAFTDDALGDLDAVGVAEAIRAGDLNPVDATEAAIARVEAVNPTLNGVAHEDFERARSQASATHPHQDQPFAGVPSFIKDNNDVAGMPTRSGSEGIEAHPARSSFPSAKQFMAQGYVILGKTTLPEFGLSASTEFPNEPPTRNPWNTDYSAGASSGGSAALVASGAVPIAHANDGGGSIRIPAAANGLVGLKLTRARTLDQPGARLLPINLVSEGVVSRTVRDTAHHLAAMERSYHKRGLPAVGLVRGASRRRLRVGLASQSPAGYPVDAETLTDLHATADLVSSLGHQVVTVELPSGPHFEPDFVLYWGLLAKVLSTVTALVHKNQFDPEKLSPVTLGLAKNWREHWGRTPFAIRRLRATRAAYEAMFNDLDVVLSPTLNHRVPKIGHLDPSLPFDQVIARLTRYVGFTPVNNVTGGPGISLPTPVGTDGLPGSIHFSAAWGNEATLLHMAYELEEARPFARITDADAV